MEDSNARAAYVHVPFCLSKCGYCDFHSFPGLEPLFERYVEAVTREMQFAVSRADACLDTVYVGGGTPTVLPARMLERILSALGEKYGISPGAEVTVEANPGTVDARKLARLRRAGFNRISLGVQSFDDAFLQRLGRVHTACQSREAFQAARSAGFTNLGLDLMFALPGQDLGHWEETLDAAVELRPEHISAYELTIEDGTPFARLREERALELPSEDQQAEMYEAALEKLTGAGYQHYEVSNFALPGFRCRHNIVYWRNESYYGFGAGATSYVSGTRARRISDPEVYVAATEAGQEAVEASESLRGRAALAETVIQELRFVDGIELDDCLLRTGSDIAAEFAAELSCLTRRGLIEITGNVLRTTRQGLLLLNDISAEFLP